MGGTVVQWLALLPHNKRVLGSNCVEFACSPCACVGSLRVLRLPPTVQRHAVYINSRL